MYVSKQYYVVVKITCCYAQVYEDIRDRHFSNVFGFLSAKAKELQAGYDVSSHLRFTFFGGPSNQMIPTMSPSDVWLSTRVVWEIYYSQP